MTFRYPAKVRSQVKRLDHRQARQPLALVDLPRNVFTESLLEKPVKYVKYFDYPLQELLVDQSTDPMQNTTRQYVKASTFLSNHFSEGRFADHQMIVRRQGETSILRPRQDPVLANGFTPVIRPSSLLPSYKAMDPPPSTSMTTKLSVPKPEQKLKRKARQKKVHRRLQQSTPQLIEEHFCFDVDERHLPESNPMYFAPPPPPHIIDERSHHLSAPLPTLMSMCPQYPYPSPRFTDHSQNPLAVPRFDRAPVPSVSFYERSFPTYSPPIPSKNYPESFYDFTQDTYCRFPSNQTFQMSFPQGKHRMHDEFVHSPSMFHHRQPQCPSGYFF